MNIHGRILLSHAYLVVLLVVGAGGAALGFHQLGRTLGRVLSENFASIAACTDMLQALERQDREVVAVLLGDGERRAPLEEAERSFAAALQRATENVTLIGEEALVRAVAEQDEAFRAACDGLLANPPARALQAHDEAALPRFEAARQAVQALFQANQEAMLDADRRAQRQARVLAVLFAVLVTVALLSLGPLARGMRRSLLDRLAELHDVAEAGAAGDRLRRASVAHEDELGLVARQLNAALDSSQRLENEMRGRLSQQRQALLGLLALLPEQVALVAPDGRLVASTLTEAEERLVERCTQRLDRGAGAARAAPGPAELPSRDQVLTQDGRNLRFQLLIAPSGRVAGWLATLEGASGGDPNR
ncbi:MAG: methyl-accepting chemotaxis protein [Planctomycetes bacterium]|nr:methyl-accepting chemotaxis protein [Planctomycetota bacterium]